MHYANGRPANNGDRVMHIVPPGQYNKSAVGILHDAVMGNDTCNGGLAVVSSDQCPNLAECLHHDDVIAALGDITKIRDTSKLVVASTDDKPTPDAPTPEESQAIAQAGDGMATKIKEDIASGQGLG